MVRKPVHLGVGRVETNRFAGGVRGDAEADGHQVKERLEFGVAMLQLGIEPANLGLGQLTLGDLKAELVIDLRELGGAGATAAERGGHFTQPIFRHGGGHRERMEPAPAGANSLE